MLVTRRASCKINFLCTLRVHSKRFFIFFKLFFLLVVLQEIEDRKGFLDEMEKLGQGKKYRTIIMTEISQVRMVDRRCWFLLVMQPQTQAVATEANLEVFSP